MTTFVFTELVQSPHADVVSAALGASTSTPLTENDVGKLVKMSTASNYVLCATTDEIEGVLESVEPYTVNSGFGFGSVRKNGRITAVVGANQSGTLIAGEYCTADTQAAVGTAGPPKVLQLADPAGAVVIWKCIRVLSGTGEAGDSVLIERVS
jgi:hypothetical protein